MQKEIVNILTVDVEDYYMVSAFENIVRFEDWDKYESRVVKNTEKILEILIKADIKATFFILGWIAERFPGLVRRIHQAGHEIASHGYVHQLIYNQPPSEFKEDIRKSRIILEDIIQESVLGYRAPSYSITKKSTWALDILMEEGFKYDSSVFPIHHDKGGLPEANRFPHKIYNHSNYIWEFPLSTIRILNQNIPFSGGGYFRLLPYNFIKKAIKKINQDGHPVIIYIHPWELDSNQPRINIKGLNKFRHYVSLDKTEKKLRRLVYEFKVLPIKNFLKEYEK